MKPKTFLVVAMALYAMGSLSYGKPTNSNHPTLRTTRTRRIQFERQSKGIKRLHAKSKCIHSAAAESSSPSHGLTIFPDDQNAHKMNLTQAVFLAREDAKCLSISCKTLTEKPIILSSIQCEQLCNTSKHSHLASVMCIQTCFKLYSDLQKSTIFFNSSHQVPYRILGKEASSHSKSKEKIQVDEMNTLRDVNVFCEGVYREENALEENDLSSPHFVLLRWSLVTSSDLTSGNGSYPRSSPLIYVIEQKEGNGPLSELEWRIVGKTPSGLQTVRVSYRSFTYKWRITAVSPEGIKDIAETAEYITLDGYKNPGPPSRIYVIDIEMQNSSVSVLIGWEPPPENACFYKIILEGRESQTETIHINEPLGVHQYWFRDLSFEKMYHVRMTSQNPTWDFESNFTDMNFKTPTCLQSFNYRFDKCAPPKVNENSISATMQMMEKEEDKEQLFQVEFTWAPPLYASENNTLEKYVVELTNFTGGDLTQDIIPMGYSFGSTNQYVVSGNVTRLILKNLRSELDYTVMITAYSAGGGSQRSQYRFSTKPTSETHVYDLKWLVYAAITFAVAIVLLLLLWCVRIKVPKSSMALSKSRYFQTLEKRFNGGSKFSTPISDGEQSKWQLFDENFSKEKWEICLDDLTMAEVVGQGAFGVVHRAKISKMKLEQKLRFRGEAETWLKSADRNTEVADPAVETVAVKTVIVSTTRNDLEQLSEEIATMQNLKFHSQIVGLLGACTKGNMLYLVLEYCPGGDLLSFLRKVRVKYRSSHSFGESNHLPQNENEGDINLNGRVQTDGKTTCSSGGSDGRGNSSSSGFASGSGNAKSSGSSLASCVDMTESFESSSSSGVGSDNSSGAGLQKLESGSGTARDFLSASGQVRRVISHLPSVTDSLENPREVIMIEDKNLRPIDEMDVLSYARQIAMGMEYLEKNHVVHRDLACRNILLMGDYRHVKISDFGLSRDVYTNNMYHQKSDGKLPFRWMAIESIFTHDFTTKSDVWAFGIILWELITLGGIPYPGLGNMELFQLLESGYRMERPEKCSKELYAIMKNCWNDTPTSRPSFSELRAQIEAMMEKANPNLYFSFDTDKYVQQSNSKDDTVPPVVAERKRKLISRGPQGGHPHHTPTSESSSENGTDHEKVDLVETYSYNSALNKRSNFAGIPQLNTISVELTSLNGSTYDDDSYDYKQIENFPINRTLHENHYEEPNRFRGSNANEPDPTFMDGSDTSTVLCNKAIEQFQSHEIREEIIELCEMAHTSELSSKSRIPIFPRNSVADENEAINNKNFDRVLTRYTKGSKDMSTGTKSYRVTIPV